MRSGSSECAIEAKAPRRQAVRQDETHRIASQQPEISAAAAAATSTTSVATPAVLGELNKVLQQIAHDNIPLIMESIMNPVSQLPIDNRHMIEEITDTVTQEIKQFGVLSNSLSDQVSKFDPTSGQIKQLEGQLRFPIIASRF